MLTVGITDDHHLIINGLTNVLQQDPNYSILFTAQCGAELLGQLSRQCPDVLLLDIELPDINGVDLCERILYSYPDLAIIALTSYDDILYVKKIMRKGARGYLLKSTDIPSLFEAIQLVASGRQYIDRQIEQHILTQAIHGRKTTSNVKLTNRELEVLGLIANEQSNQEIADQLFLSVRTIESHRHSINQKLNIKTAAGLVKEAILRGLL